MTVQEFIDGSAAPDLSWDQAPARIKVIGVGGGGCNCVRRMLAHDTVPGVEFVVVNTDIKSLETVKQGAEVIQIGQKSTQGWGAGGDYTLGVKAAEESSSVLRRALKDAELVFITAGMGGGTGTGAAPIISRIAKEAGALTVAVVTKPFQFEGRKRAAQAEEGILELKNAVDTLIVIPNQNLFRVANEKTTFADAFKMADDVLYSGVRGVTDLMVMPGLINLDFADVRSVMAEMGKAMMGTGEAEGEGRAI